MRSASLRYQTAREPKFRRFARDGLGKFYRPQKSAKRLKFALFQPR